MIIDETTGEVMEIITTNERGELTVPNEIINAMSEMERQKKAIEKQFNVYRDALRDAMAQHGVTSIKTDDFTATYIEEHEQVRLDSKAVQEMYPRVYDDCSKIVPVKASVKVRLK